MPRLGLYISVVVFSLSSFFSFNQGFAAEFNVGKGSEVSIKKVTGSVTIIGEPSRQLASGQAYEERISPGEKLKLAANSEVWLKVFRPTEKKTSFLKIASPTCPTSCNFDENRGTIITSTSTTDCEGAINLHDKARQIAGLPPQNRATVDSSSLVSFAARGGGGEGGEEGGVLFEFAEGPPAVTIPDDNQDPPCCFVEELPGQGGNGSSGLPPAVGGVGKPDEVKKGSLSSGPIADALNMQAGYAPNNPTTGAFSVTAGSQSGPHFGPAP